MTLSTPTETEWQQAIVMAAGITGVGLIAYHAVMGIREGDILAVDPVAEPAKAHPLLVGAGGALTVFCAVELARDVGWKPVVFGSVGIAVLSGLRQLLP